MEAYGGVRDRSKPIGAKVCDCRQRSTLQRGHDGVGHDIWSVVWTDEHRRVSDQLRGQPAVLELHIETSHTHTSPPTPPQGDTPPKVRVDHAAALQASGAVSDIGAVRMFCGLPRRSGGQCRGAAQLALRW